MGLIQLENMEFYAYHGHYAEEQKIGNKFRVNLYIETDLNKPAISDKLEDTINYRSVYEIVKSEMKNKSHLLENIGYRIINALYDNFNNIKSITIKVSKLNPPMGGIMDAVSVTLTR